MEHVTMNMMHLQNSSKFQMKHLTKKVFFIVSVAFSFQCMAANNVQIIDKGQDGNTHYYTAACPNGTNGSVAVHFNETTPAEVSPEALELTGPIGIGTSSKSVVTKICASVGSENEKCNSSWDIQAAAKASCK